MLLGSASENAVVTAPDTLWAATLTIPSAEVPNAAVIGLAGSSGIRFVADVGLRDSLIVWCKETISSSRRTWSGSQMQPRTELGPGRW